MDVTCTWVSHTQLTVRNVTAVSNSALAGKCSFLHLHAHACFISLHVPWPHAAAAASRARGCLLCNCVCVFVPDAEQSCGGGVYCMVMVSKSARNVTMLLTDVSAFGNTAGGTVAVAVHVFGCHN